MEDIKKLVEEVKGDLNEMIQKVLVVRWKV